MRKSSEYRKNVFTIKKIKQNDTNKSWKARAPSNPWFIPIGNGGFGFPRVKTCVQSMFSGLAFSNDKYFSMLAALATYHPPHFLSDLLLYT